MAKESDDGSNLVLVAFAVLGDADWSLAQTTEWAWFRSESNGTSWWTTDGRAEVTMSGERFEARLRDSEYPTFIRLSLQGRSLNGVITARVRVESSDVGDFDVSGRVRRLCWRNGGGRETIILTDGHHVVGLVRELSASSRCAPAYG